jgi:chromosome segregation ATPase
VRDIRADFAAVSEQNRHDLEEWYKIKVEELADQAARRDTTDASSHQLFNKTESPTSLKSSLNDHTNEYTELSRHNQSLAMRLVRLEEQLESSRQANAVKLDECDREYQSLSGKYNDLVEDYDQLLHNKASIEFEINAYRRLLESEESRNNNNSSNTNLNHTGDNSKTANGGGGGGVYKAFPRRVSKNQFEPSDTKTDLNGHLNNKVNTNCPH